ncbi:MAG: 3-dehydroquinate synthase family protein [Cyanobacteria bacterium P01_H01_bin.74]
MAELISIPVAFTSTPERNYSILIGENCLHQLGTHCRSVLPITVKIMILTDATVDALYGKALQDCLNAAGYATVIRYAMQPGEVNKSLETAQAIYTTLLTHHFTRKDAIVALGGGVVGDLAGFCAATFYRGLALVHVPTTLIAQVDSSIGGKTAVNFGAVKNSVGVFYQPKLIFMDAAILADLPVPQYTSGMAEVIKYGLIETACNPEQSGFFDWLYDQSTDGSLQSKTLEMITRCASIKVGVITEDEFETKGLRHFLNMGHTFGHAYEALAQLETANTANRDAKASRPSATGDTLSLPLHLSHGEAVALGMIKALQFSVQSNLIEESVLQKTIAIYRAVGLGHCINPNQAFTPEAVIQKMRQDKKNRDTAIQAVLPVKAAGHSILQALENEALLHTVLEKPAV